MNCPFCNSEMRNFHTHSVPVEKVDSRFDFSGARDINFKFQEFIPKSFLSRPHYEEKVNTITPEQYICPNCGYLAEFIPKRQLQFMLDKAEK